MLKQNPTPEHSNPKPPAECFNNTDFSVRFININVSSFHFSDKALGQPQLAPVVQDESQFKNYSCPCEQQYFSTPARQVPNEAQK